ncbi:MAG: hypothetical protein L6Q55_02040 [Azonexus sp.]|nr:hypothetical protein [Azonexus sp.]MCK6411189.1 hypothetical protein [Azonexus sp.]
MRTLAFFFRLIALSCIHLPLATQAGAPALRPSAELLFKHPELLQPGQCVLYEEGREGWMQSEPQYYLRGEVISAEIRRQTVVACPDFPGKNCKSYPREGYKRLLLAPPCGERAESERQQQVGMVRIRVQDWETPHERKAENAGRLWRGKFIDHPLERDLEIELEADLLGPCRNE